ncbi:MAG: TIGR04282 family arsenosugar biosynthesis glycosyltransferase [Solirubrobacterales bacterium]|nr:TIGR04282 family arsenosugar biosynthesis glycosyltransferase [Solirubrobacterales bacterium]
MTLTETISPALLVLAKAPRAGAVKTRLCPPLTPTQAAELAEAALLDTLTAVLATPGARAVLILDGEAGAWMPAGIDLLPQRTGDLATRLADAFADIAGPALLIGMDTPQVTPALLTRGLDLLQEPHNDAVLGHTDDGGYWAIGLRRGDRRVFEGVPMSTERTGIAQHQRLIDLGLRVGILPSLRDVDRFEDAQAVCREAPDTRLAHALAEISRALRETVAA